MGQLDLIGFGYEGGIDESYRPAKSDKCTQSRGAAAKKRARGPGAPDAAWTLEPHVCRHCFGRLASLVRPDGDVRYQCTNCGAEAVGLEPDVLCACGLKLRNHGPVGGVVDAGLRCQPNPEPSPDFPSRYVAAPVKT